MLAQFTERNIHLKLSDEGKILATGPLTDGDRETIRRNREYLAMELQKSNPSEQTPEQVKLALGIEQEVSIVLVGPEFSHWSSDCRRGWARSVLDIIKGDKLTIKPACIELLKAVAREGR